MPALSIVAIVWSVGLTQPASAQPQQGGAVPPAWEAEAALEELRIGPAGVGPVRTGMTVAQAERALDLPLRAEPPALDEGDALADWQACHYESTLELPGVVFTVNDGRVVRVDVEAGDWDTTEGVRIGTPEAEVLRRYPGIAVRPHPYAEFGHYLVLERTGPDGDPEELIFETDGREVTSFRSGAAEPVGRVEGCS